MPQIKPGRFTKLPKGYITYPIGSDDKAMELARILLDEHKRTRYVLNEEVGGVPSREIPKSMWEILKESGANVDTIVKSCTEGKDKLFGIPVEVRKINQGTKLKAVRVRVTGETEAELLKNIEKIKDELKDFYINPTECVWVQGEWKESSIGEETPPKQVKQPKQPKPKQLSISVNEEIQPPKPELTEQNEYEKELKRVLGLVEDLKDKVTDLEKPAFKKALERERKMREEVCK